MEKYIGEKSIEDIIGVMGLMGLMQETQNRMDLFGGSLDKNESDLYHAFIEQFKTPEELIMTKHNFKKLYSINASRFVLISDSNNDYGKKTTSFYNKGSMRGIISKSGRLSCCPDFTTNGLNIVDVSNTRNYFMNYVDFCNQKNNQRIMFSRDFNISDNDIPDELAFFDNDTFIEFLAIASNLPDCLTSVFFYNPNLIYDVTTADVKGDSCFDTIRSNGILRNGMSQVLTPDNQEAYNNTTCIFANEADYVVIATIDKRGLESKVLEVNIFIKPEWLKQCMEHTSKHFPNQLRYLETIYNKGFIPLEKPIEEGYSRRITHHIIRENIPF